MSNKKNIKISFLVLVFSLLFGFLGGLFSYFYFYNNHLLFGDLDLNSWDYNSSNFVIQDAKNVVISQDLKVEENINYFNEAVLGLFKKDETAKDLYFLDNNIIEGLVISSDGWVLMNISFLSTFDKSIIKNKESYILVSKKNKKVYEIIDHIYYEKDQLLLFKIKDVNNFPVKPFYDFSKLKVGQTLVSYNFLGETEIYFLKSKNNNLGVVNIDEIKNELKLNNKPSDSFKNSFLFDLNGSLVALISNDLKIYPINDLKFLIFSFFKNKEIKDVKLGLNYIDFSNIFSIKNNFYSEGAWVYNNGALAVEKGLLADLAGIRTGDIIIRVNDYKIDKDNNLFDILNNFVYGDKLTFYVIRDDKQIEIKMDLK